MKRIILTNEHGIPIRVNADMIVRYRAHPLIGTDAEEIIRPAKSMVVFLNGATLEVQQTPEQIDRLIDPISPFGHN